MLLTVILVDHADTLVNRLRHPLDQCELDHELVVVADFVNQLRTVRQQRGDYDASGLVGEEDSGWGFDRE